MLHIGVLLVTFSFVWTTTLAAAPSVEYVLHEKRQAAPKRWVKKAAVHDAAVLPMRIGMHQSNLEHGDRLLMERADPASPKYGEWYTAEQVTELFAPPQQAVDDIRAWLEGSGIHPRRISHSTNKQWIQFDASTKEAKALFNTTFHFYEHTATGSSNIACDEYHLPAHISKHVDYITPGLKLLTSRKDPKQSKIYAKSSYQSSQEQSSEAFRVPTPPTGIRPSPNANPPYSFTQGYIVPSCIATLYNITQGTRNATGNQLGIYETGGDYLSPNDLANFLYLYGGQVPYTTAPTLDGIDGGGNVAESPPPGSESDMDFQLAIPIVYPQGTILFQVDDWNYEHGLLPQGGGWNTFLDALDGSYCTYSAYGETGDASSDPTYPDNHQYGWTGSLQCGVYKPTNVISVSWLIGEDDLPTNYMQRECNEFMKLGMQGVSVVYASGDYGVAGFPGDGGNTDSCLGTGQVFIPMFPASCPYVTAVGGTWLPWGNNVTIDQETAPTYFASGGGFSNVFSQPSYQNSSVTKYLAFQQTNTSYPSYALTDATNNPTPAQYGKGIFNRVGRAYPDVSAMSYDVVVYYNGSISYWGGTSAATPIFASILTRINEERIYAGKSTVGFVNPVLCANPGAFHDIVVGNSSGCQTTSGFFTNVGWDPVTGLGTPNYPTLLNTFLALK